MALSSAAVSLHCFEDAAAWGDDEDEGAEDEWSAPPSPRGAVAVLVAAEREHLPRDDYLSRFVSRALDAAARHEAVSWILKVNHFYRFRPVTAYLAVNYLDRFLSSNALPVALPTANGRSGGGGGGWPIQLLSVACLSVAAKMEETHVPLLLDLQVLDPGYVFEPRTVRRMELLLMSALRWRMRAVTPFDFLDLVASAAALVHISSSRRRALLSRASWIILSTHRVVGFLAYRPSVVAAAAVMCAAAEAAEFAAIYAGDFLACFHELVNKETVSGCRQLMEELLLIDTCPSRYRFRSRAEPPAPPSPVGVLDAAACASSDTQKSTADAEPGRAEPPPMKRRKLRDYTASIDTGGDGKDLKRD